MAAFAFLSGGAAMSAEVATRVGPADSDRRGSDEFCALDSSKVRGSRPPSPRRHAGDRPSVAAVLPVRAGLPCSPSEFAALSGGVLVEALAGSSEACLGSLWSFDADVATVLGSANVVQVSSAMTADAANLILNASRLDRLALVHQIAFFHEFFQSSLTYDAATFQAAQSGLMAIASSPDFFDAAPTVKDLREQWTISIDSVNGTHLAIGTIQAILDRYSADPALALDAQERRTAWRPLLSLQRQLWNQSGEGPSSPWWGLLSSAFVSSVASIALDTAYPAEAEYVVNNALYALGHFALVDPPVYDGGQQALSGAYAVHVQYGAPWLWAVIALENFYDAELAGGVPLDMPQIRADVTAIALPATFTLDQGRTRFRTAESSSTILDLYDALQEVESQFFRKTTFVRPVPGDLNETIELVIYASPSHYQLYQPFLYGLPTNNGGIYIEGDGRLYTYQRTPQQSIFTLEELLRHEFTHYLDSRYVIVPSFGDPGSVYDGSRLVWYNEGLAEYMVGSTRVNGVLVRTNLLQQIENDPTWMSVADILGADYADGFDFYPYSGLLFSFLAADRPDLLEQLFGVIRGDDIAAIDAFYASLSTDPVLQQEFDDFLTQSIAEMNAGQGLFAEDVPTTLTPQGLPGNNSAAIRGALSSAVATDGGSYRVWPDRFRYTGALGLPLTGPESTASALLDAEMNMRLNQLAPLLDNFLSAVAWFGDVVIDDGVAWATFAIEGPHQVSAGDVVAPQPPTGLLAAPGAGSIVLNWHESPELDIAGYRVHRATTDGGPYVSVGGATILERQYADRSVVNATDYFYRVTAIDASGNESGYSAQAEASMASIVLLVNGYFNSTASYVNAYADALDAYEVPYVLWETATQGEVPSAVLDGFVDGLVVWSVGYFNSPSQMSSTQQAAILDYLDGGGSFVFSGAFKANALDDTELFTDYLYCTHVGFNIDMLELDGLPGDLLGDGLTLSMDFLGYESEVDVVAPATAGFIYDMPQPGGGTSSSGTGVFTVDTHYKVAYLAFPFADIDEADGLALFGRILDWTLPAVVAPVTLRFLADKTTLNWDAVPAAQSYEAYRGSVAQLVDEDDDGLPDPGFGDCRNFADHSADTIFDTYHTDSQTPLGAGGGWFYLVGFRTGGQSTGLGTTGAGLDRVPSNPCP